MKYRVSVLCDCFATFEVEAETEAAARVYAMGAGHHELAVELHTLTPKIIEKVEVEEEAA